MNIKFEDAEPPVKNRSAKYTRYNQSEKGRKRTHDYKIVKGPDNYLERPFVAYDGEGITLPLPVAAHYYTLFASSAGLKLQDDNGLKSQRIFNSLLKSKLLNPDAIHVIYGGSYDFNLWLATVPISKVEKLYRDGTVTWLNYRLTWRRGKSFQIKDRSNGVSITVYDVVSFFQRPFVEACDDYLGDRFIERDMIVANKASRGTFTVEDNEQVDKYNQAELDNLVMLMEELRLRLHNVQLRPRRWDGPGAIATALMQREHIKRSMSVCPEPVAEAGRYSYFGGRFEMLKCGDTKQPAWEYDINSAYPSALRHVPNLNNGTWTRAKKPRNLEDFAVFRVQWESGPDWHPGLPHPFPCRFPDGRVWYPPSVSGWYWSPEVYTAEFSGAGTLRILEGWRFVENDPTDKPFSFIEPMYLQRQALKAAGDGAHVGLKLALNSLYGKTCQRIGYRIDKNGNVRTPPFHQLEWAGFVTSHCRATIYNAALQSPDDVIAFETDALFMRTPLELPVGKGLGEWEATEFEQLTYAQSGFYFGVVDGKPFAKTRGVDRGSVTYADAEGKFWSDNPYVNARLTRFNGVGLALLHNRWDKWRTWETLPKNVSLTPSGKRVHYPEHCEACFFGKNDDWHECYVPWQHGLESSPFPIPWINPDMAMVALEEMTMTENHADEMSLRYE